MKDYIKVKKILLDKQLLSRGIVAEREFEDNFLKENFRIGYKILNGDYKDYILINEEFNGLGTSHFVSPKPLSFSNPQGVLNGYIPINEFLYKKAIEGRSSVKSFDSSISYSYLLNLIQIYFKNNIETNVRKNRSLSSLQKYYETGVKNFPEPAFNNKRMVYGFVPISKALVHSAKNTALVQLTKNGINNDDIIKKYQLELASNIKELMASKENENSEELADK